MPNSTSYSLSLALLGLLLPVAAGAQSATVLSTLPSRHANNAVRTAPVTITFSRAVPAAAAANIKLFGNQQRGQRAVAVSGGGTATISLQPAQPFSPGEKVSVTIPASVASPPRVFGFTAAAGPALATFGAPVTLGPPPGNQPAAVVAGDVDNDGDLDLVVGEFQGSQARICLNNGAGQFTAQPLTVSIAAFPRRMYLTDVTGDGNLDLLVTTANGSDATLALGTGQGTFSGRQNLSNNFFPEAATADFNADGIQDIVLASSNLLFLPGAPAGLGSGRPSPLTLTVRALAAADMDEDGDQDLLILTEDRLHVYLNDGTGQFSAGSSTAVNIFAQSLVVADFNNDGHMDAACSSALTANVSLVLGTGTGGLQPFRNVAALSRTYHVGTGDLDGDGDQDLLVTNDRGITQILLNDGQANFASANAVLIGFESFTMAAAADLNGDNALDVYTGHQTSNPSMPHGIDVFFNQLRPQSLRGGRSSLPLALYPNPAHDQVTLQLPPASGVVTVEVLNVLGQAVAAPTVGRPAADGTLSVALQNLAPGVYAVRVRAGDASTTQRLVVE
ncbi:FG-GAP-like repeat-containing protein [Hymenobacter persicinus]|uniref:T9SS type A sorting domain-containing protein n=1 Tax=Hymenobacter persicinus TaxID=2025506 RepID=A0A4Q5LB95_9BACT|nr:FG-GAP-like repeat-containing protein [Hymenobacter persicinus]RYU79125.1 T9SS type A sorting domain-containing protein [Hymenobacter persicinus]